jgi:hypothetical protein
MIKNLKEKFQNILNWRNQSLKDDEIIAVLSHTVWKTRNKILEEINETRRKAGTPLVPKYGSGFYEPSYKFKLLSKLIHLEKLGEVEEKKRDELSELERAWASKADLLDERDINFSLQIGLSGDLSYFKLANRGKREGAPEEKAYSEKIEPLAI